MTTKNIKKIVISISKNHNIFGKMKYSSSYKIREPMKLTLLGARNFYEDRTTSEGLPTERPSMFSTIISS